jgi:coenzyme F420-reducing hydrogenase delta subunit
MRREDPDIGRVLNPAGLTEFETGSTNSLAPFEDESSILLDEYTTASPQLLDEFESSIEIIHSIQPVPLDPDENQKEDGSEGDGDSEKGEESKSDEDSENADVSEDLIVTDAVKAPELPTIEELSWEDRTANQEPKNPVIGFVCTHAVDFPGITDSRGRMIGRSSVHMIELPCAGMVKPGWLTKTLENGASGVFVLACVPGVCHHRRGSCIIHGRLEGSREPMLDEDADRGRIRLFDGHVNSRDEVLKQIEEFLVEVSSFDRAIDTKPIIPEEIHIEFGEIEGDV